MPSTRHRPLAPLAGVLLLAGCTSSDAITNLPDDPDTVCTAELRPGVVVEVVDARSGAYVASGARGVLREGAFVDSLVPAAGRGTPPNDTLLSLQGAFERAGTYEVAVTRAGYQAWRQSGVRVTRDACHVSTVTVTARLAPAS